MMYATALLLLACRAALSRATDECAASLSAEDVARYQSDGYVIIRNLFSAAEADVLRRAIETDPLVASNDMPMVDSAGSRSKLTLWNYAGNDTFGYFARGKRWANAARRLIGSPIYHFHTKVMLKEPRVGGTWEWHQDFGYWYQVGCLAPDMMLSAILAVDNHTIENGCMQLLSGSHRLGRLAHGVSGEQAGVDQEALGKAVKRFPKVYATMQPGDVLFTHSNLLHSSAPNESPSWRRSLIVAYNAIENPPRPDTICPLPAEAPLEPLFDDAEILTRGVVRIDPAREFLDHARNAAQFSKGSS
jgi:ectoine hydroxylase-related dioxygenase (phytanoyl-CoA dioxygenase family)